MSIPFLFWKEFGIKQGWGIEFYCNELLYKFESYDPYEVIQYHHDTFSNVLDIQDMEASRRYCIRQWYIKDPEKYIGDFEDMDIKNIQIYGQVVWCYLNVININFEKQYALDTVRYITRLIGPESDGYCEWCHKNWLESLKQYPPEEYIRDRDTYIKWVFNVHNLANKHSKKAQYTWEQFKREWQV